MDLIVALIIIALALTAGPVLWMLGVLWRNKSLNMWGSAYMLFQVVLIVVLIVLWAVTTVVTRIQ